MDDAVDAADPRLAGIRPSQIPTRKALQMTGPDGNPLVLFDNISPATPSGKIELKSETLAKRWGAAALLPGWREREAPPLLMNPKDAAQRSLGHGIEVRVWNDRGEVILPLEVTDDVPPGVVASEKGAWLSTSRTGQTISALVSADLRADLAEGACFNDTPVEVSRA